MSIVEKLFSFRGGLHPPGFKELTRDKAIRQIKLPSELIIPLHQHIGESAVPIVSVGNRVLKGQKIARAEGYVSASIHASSSGTVVAIEERQIPHPSGLKAPCIVIRPDGKDIWAEPGEISDYKTMEPSHLRNLIRTSGIVGLGGAGFPSFIKLNPAGRKVEVLILNGVECEPYITCDDRLMRERSQDIIEGIAIMRHALNAESCVIAIEDNKPEAFKRMTKATAGTDIKVVKVPTRYPQGSEKQLITVLTGKECPSDGLPIDIGVVVHNVGTAASVHNAINLGRPLISRIMTITGDGIDHPANLEVPFGTPIQHLLDECGGVKRPLDRVILGGPMMGYAMHTTYIPVVKTTNCVLAATRASVAPPCDVMPCIRCGTCAGVCPVNLLPQQLYWYSKSQEFEKAQEYNLFDCIECGCCAFVCPSSIPLVHYFRYAKTEIGAQEREKEKADKARQRHEARQERIDREKAEKAAKLAKKKAALKAVADKKAAAAKDAPEDATSDADKDKKAEIAAAMARAKAKKAEKGVTPKNTDNLTDAQKRKIEEADAVRAKADEMSTQKTDNVESEDKGKAE